MNSTDRDMRAGGGSTDPRAGGESAGPDSLAALVNWIMDDRGFANLRQLSRQTRVPYQTLYAWKTGTRNLQRPPAVPILKQLAEDFNLSEAIVFRAAGRAFDQPDELSQGELQVLHLYQELDEEDRAIAESMLRSLAERARHQQVPQN